MIKQGLVIGLANLVVMMGLNFGLEKIFPQLAVEYQSGLFRPWTDPLMMVYFLYPFINGMVLAYFWRLIKTKDPLKFTGVYFLVATVPVMFVSYTSFQISFLMVSSWALMGFLEALIAGLILVRLNHSV